MQVGLMTKHYRWIITNLDAHSINLEPYQYSGANITTFRLLDTGHAIFDQVPKANDFENNDDLFNVDPDIKLDTDNERCRSDVDKHFPTYPQRFRGK